LNFSPAKTADAIVTEYFAKLLPHLEEKDKLFKVSILKERGF
jgi:hypothetical protein